MGCFAGKVTLVKASSYFYYRRGGFAQKLIAEIKYRANLNLGEWIGDYIANDMISSGFLKFSTLKLFLSAV